jgi:CO/xanthine dehydrogenase FAD-binding subunit
MRYEVADSVAGAASLLAAEAGQSYVLAGGTDLLVQLRAGMVSPDLVVDIKGLDETRTISESGGAYTIGAAVAGAELGEHDTLGTVWPGVTEGAELIGSTQIQGRASMGGNLCNASPAADAVPALIAADATCTVIGPDGTREAAVADIPTGPGSNSLGKGEFVVSINLPARPARSSDAYLRMIPRTEMDIAIVGAAVNLTLDDDGVCTAAKVVLGAVAPTAIDVPAAADALIGTRLDDDALAAASAAASAAANPISDKRGTVEYRTKVAGVLTKRAARIAYDRAQEGGAS